MRVLDSEVGGLRAAKDICHRYHPHDIGPKAHWGGPGAGLVLASGPAGESLERFPDGRRIVHQRINTHVFRDPAQNVSIKLRLEEAKLNKNSFRTGQTRQGGATKYSPILNSEEK
jgi:hypothetical protein